ncbi:uncharacterized protein PHACADRAFT_202121 [Phanerochaete carnosa HHB-10118-sp]|uniref:NADP-dependent oxidoreductase domain-containing protein n=1 Tax=Phanerochaete carnosa (strain HHB-10118-sp) TaxID=650164 RepID=K5VR08_PHACS|nr:uncharacterized protein PHACADRAFT_202121 [Phanerochaete carnosa HHB-10118-sp]EKM49009.1 hypothetical protein PHACADRAFT_202121 [Phanerochaete carnosa HHB-10118-sp]
MRNSIEDSLRKLRTDYVDILYIHRRDYVCSVEEVMDGLHALVQQGKVLYPRLGPFVRANSYARCNDKTPFAIYQGMWSIIDRDLERDILPMCISEGLAIAPWNVLGGGKLRTDAEEQRCIESGEEGRKLTGDWKRTLEHRRKASYVFPIIGGRKVGHLHQNLEALSLHLNDEHVKRLDDIVPFNKGWPYNCYGNGTDYFAVWKVAGHFDKWPKAGAIKPPV